MMYVSLNPNKKKSFLVTYFDQLLCEIFMSTFVLNHRLNPKDEHCFKFTLNVLFGVICCLQFKGKIHSPQFELVYPGILIHDELVSLNV